MHKSQHSGKTYGAFAGRNLAEPRHASLTVFCVGFRKNISAGRSVPNLPRQEVEYESERDHLSRAFDCMTWVEPVW